MTDRQTFSNGEPVPTTGAGKPCSECVKRDEPCSRYGHDGSAAPQGRPTELDDTTRERIIGAARIGANRKGCARAGGISPRTLTNWLNAGERGEPPFDKFYASFMRARSEKEAELLERTEKQDPRFLLERSYRYWKTERQEVTGRDGGPLRIETLADELADVDADLAERVLAKLREAA